MLISIICLVQGDILLRPLPVVKKHILRQTGKSTPCRKINPGSTPPIATGENTYSARPGNRFHVGKYTLWHLGDRPHKDLPCKWLSPPLVSMFLATALLQLLSFCKVEHATALHKVVFPSFWPLHSCSCCRSARSNMPLRFRKLRFHLSGCCTLRLLSFCYVEQYHCASELVFPYFWPLHASPSNHRPGSFLFILLRTVG